MLLLIVEAGGMRYGVPASRIVEIIPAPVLQPLAGLPGFVPGVFTYHNRLVPVVDLSALLTGQMARPLLSTRMVLVNLRPKQGAAPLILGLLAEHATEMLSCARDEFQAIDSQVRSAPFASEILVHPDGLVQKLNVDRVLTPELQDQLFGAAA